VESNKLAGSRSPKESATAQNFLETEEARRALAAIGNELRGATGYLEIGLRRTNVTITAVMSEQPDSPRRLTYSEQGGLEPLTLGSPLHDGFKKDWLFTLPELEPIWPLLDELKRKAVDRLQLSGGTVERVTFYRNSVFYRRIERCSSKSGWTIRIGKTVESFMIWKVRRSMWWEAGQSRHPWQNASQARRPSGLLG
jgi:hypothetical protein